MSSAGGLKAETGSELQDASEGFRFHKILVREIVIWRFIRVASAPLEGHLYQCAPHIVNDRRQRRTNSAEAARANENAGGLIDRLTRRHALHPELHFSRAEDFTDSTQLMTLRLQVGSIDARALGRHRAPDPGTSPRVLRARYSLHCDKPACVLARMRIAYGDLGCRRDDRHCDTRSAPVGDPS